MYSIWKANMVTLDKSGLYSNSRVGPIKQVSCLASWWKGPSGGMGYDQVYLNGGPH